MHLKSKLTLANSCFKALLLKKNRPVLVSWLITEHCNLTCRYCAAGKEQKPQLNTEQVLKIITQLARKGTKLIRFTGGEPLLRPDLPAIINYTRQTLGIISSLSTNGILLAENIGKIKKLDALTISLDGPEEINDYLRGKGSYRKAIQALKVAEERNIPVAISTVLTRANLNTLGYLLDLAEKLKVKIFFQPASRILLYGEQPNPVCPDAEEFRQAIGLLLKAKKRNRFIGNSPAGLAHLLRWPEETAINCVASRLFCRLDARGYLSPCSRSIIKDNSLNVAEMGLEYCLQRLISPECGNCWCSALVEINLIAGFNLGAILNAV